MELLLQDIRFAMRMLAKNPGFTLIAVIALALGIGANSAIFSVINSVLLRPLPYANAKQLVWLSENNLANGIKEEAASPPDYADWKSQNQSFAEMAAFGRASLILSGKGEPERIVGASITHNFFAVLKAEPKLGRVFLPEEDRPGNNRAVILSQGLWERRFGSDANIIGTILTLNGNPYTVVGVMPASFQHPRPGDRAPVEMWVPLGLNFNQAPRRADFLSVIARLKPGVALTQARAEMETIALRIQQQYPVASKGWGVNVVSLHERFVGDIRAALYILLGTVGFLLLIACANVANLLLARSATRQKEIAVRTALGAGRWRIVRQLLTESILLALGGGLGGVGLALAGIKLLVFFSPAGIPRIDQISLDDRVLGFTTIVSLLTGLVFGLLPALRASNPNLIGVLKDGGRNSGESVRGSEIRSLLAMAEVALSLVLLIGAGLMVKSFRRLQEVQPGFNPHQVMSMNLQLPRTKYREGPQVIAFYQELLTKASAIPGVEAVALADVLPLSGGTNARGFAIEGRPLPPPEQVIDAESYVISPNYFRTIGTPLLKGRLLSEQDKQDAPGALIINETMAKRYWPGEDPIGKRITFGSPQTGPWLTIVGIVGDIRAEGLDVEPYPQMYSSFTQAPQPGLALVARTAPDPLSLVSALRSQVLAIDKDQPVYNIRTMEQFLADSIARPRFNMLLISIFAALAAVLASLGIYGVMSYSVAQRTHEIGVRMALGARRVDMLKLIVGQAMKLTSIGVSIGLVAAFILTRLMASLLFGVSTTDPITFVSVALLLTLVALLASYLPARRATKVDPMVALRYE